MKKTQNGTTPAISEEVASAEYELIRYMAIRPEGDAEEWEVREGWVGPQGIAPLALVHYPVQKGWEVSFYKEDEDEGE